jgi:alpha-glucosidase
VYQPAERTAPLPARRHWYDWWTGAAIQGPTHLLAHAPLDVLPLYVRAGAICPAVPTASTPTSPSPTISRWISTPATAL